MTKQNTAVLPEDVETLRIATKSFGRYLGGLRSSHSPLESVEPGRGGAETMTAAGERDTASPKDDAESRGSQPKRKRRGLLTQSDVAASLGVTKGYIAQMEAGVRVPNERMIRKLSQFYRVDFDALNRLCAQARAGIPVPGEIIDALATATEEKFPSLRREAGALATQAVPSHFVNGMYSTAIWLDWAWNCVVSAPDFPNPELRGGEVAPDVKKVIIELYESGSGRRFLLPDRSGYPATADYDVPRETKKSGRNSPSEGMSVVENTEANANEG